MAKIEDQLDDVLNISKEIKQETQVVKVPQRVESMENDYKYGRETLYGLVERGQDAIDGILDLCKETEHPRAYEVAGQLIANVAGTVDKLQDLQKKLKDLKSETKNADTKIQNALFVGSTAELQKMLKKDDEIIESKTITPEETDISDK